MALASTLASHDETWFCPEHMDTADRPLPGPNSSSKVRMAQFIRAFRRAPLSKDRAVARAQAVFRKVEARTAKASSCDINEEILKTQFFQKRRCRG